MSSEAIIACIAFWIAFCLLLPFCVSLAGRSILLVVLISILLTPLAGILLLFYLGWQRQASKLRGCPYCLQLIQPSATACHHCLRPVPSVYIQDRPEKPHTFVNLFSLLGIISGVWLMVVFWPKNNDSDASYGSSAPEDNSQPAAVASPQGQTPPAPAPPTIPKPSLSSTAESLDTSHQFGKDWVVLVGGRQITGITKVMSASDNQVTLISPDSGENVLITDVPKGFLAEWGIDTKGN